METKTTHLDKEGNCFVVKTGKRGAITIYLRLANENNLRELGRTDIPAILKNTSP